MLKNSRSLSFLGFEYRGICCLAASPIGVQYFAYRSSILRGRVTYRSLVFRL